MGGPSNSNSSVVESSDGWLSLGIVTLADGDLLESPDALDDIDVLVAKISVGDGAVGNDVVPFKELGNGVELSNDDTLVNVTRDKSKLTDDVPVFVPLSFWVFSPF